MRFLLTAVLMLAVPFVYADQEEDLRRSQERLLGQMDDAATQVERLATELSSVDRQLRAAGCNFENGRLNTESCRPDAVLALGDEFGVLVTKHRDLNTNIEQLQTQRVRWEQESDAIVTRLQAGAESDARREPAAAIDKLIRLNRIAEMENQLHARWNETDSKFDDLTAALNELEGDFDTSAIGIYFQDKMGQFVNSNLFCKARKRCLVSERKEVDSKYLEELFPGMNKTRRSSEKYYDRTNNRRSGGNQ